MDTPRQRRVVLMGSAEQFPQDLWPNDEVWLKETMTKIGEVTPEGLFLLTLDGSVSE